MPFTSLKQLRKFYQLKKEGKMTQKKIDEWMAETPDLKKLPEKAPKRPTGTIRGPRRARNPR